MSVPDMDQRAERRLRLAIDIGERIFIVLIYAGLVARLSTTLAERPYNILLLLSEGLVAIFVLIRRPAVTMSVRPFDWAIALIGTSLPMLLRAGGPQYIPEIIGTGLMVSGITLAVWSKLALNKRFGIAAANRGAVISGPYRFVRHPMYAGYVVMFTGFLLNNPLAFNLLIVAATIALLVVRILAEERILKTDSVYGEYTTSVRFRLFPALF